MGNETERRVEPAGALSPGRCGSVEGQPTGSELSSDDLIALVDRWRAGDEQAARTVHEMFQGPLVRLAGGLLPGWLQQRLGPEDVVQSVFRSFFAGLRRGEFALERSCDLWLLLMAMTRKKLQKKVEFHLARKRSPKNEVTLPKHDERAGGLAARDEDAEDLVALADELRLVLAELDPRGRRVLELRLQDFDYERIAGELGTSSRTVRRDLDRIHRALADRLRAVS
jgi:RNA polymerase sigma factor (sigma-70 family)